MLPSLNSTTTKEVQRKRTAILAQRWQNCAANTYYTLNRIQLLCLGLWPYQASTCRYILITLVSIMLASSVVFQLTVFITKKYSLELLLHVLAYSIPWLIYALKYNLHCLNIKKVEVLLERIQHDWSILNNAREIEIIKKYSAIGKFITLLVILFIYVSTFVFIVIELVSIFLLDIAADVNESNIRRLPILMECFVDQQKYFFVCLLSIFLIVLCGFATVAATETFYMSLIQHACGLFQIASYRIEQALHKDVVRDITSLVERNTMIYLRIISGINMHKRAIEFLEMSKASYKSTYFVLVPLGVLSVSVNLYRLSLLITIKDYHELIISFMFVLGQFWYMFFVNYIGQEVIDHSGNVFHRIYNAHWYVAPLKTQKLLLYLMQRSIRHCTIVIGGLFVPSLQGFATVKRQFLKLKKNHFSSRIDKMD
ncbi:uncharacterized protein LOC105287477 isoform X3 [Ooceraea biroi]|uniref:uncharacterized protein LOC105287477 isoform X3 n=1 Tax=Ooceraea biroi TaxID=2015173 RepID=UPI000F07F97D|nr:uncharacterized protein LOC105287477 isoform X3 [Ooceraea biroi]